MAVGSNSTRPTIFSKLYPAPFLFFKAQPSILTRVGLESNTTRYCDTRAKSELSDESRYTELLQRYPLNRPAHVHEVSDLIVFLTSYRSGYSSGAIYIVDGGIASRRSII